MRGHVRKRGSRYTVIYDEPRDGKRRQRWKSGFRTRREAERFLTEQLQRLGDGSYAAPQKQTVAEYLAEWLPAVAATVRPLTAKKYEVVCRCHLVPKIGSFRLQALTGAHLTALYAELEREGLAPATRSSVHTAISRALSDAVREGKVTRNVAALARRPPAARSRAKSWTAGELRRFLDEATGDRLAALWRVAATTGMRRGELLGLTWRTVDLDGARLSVEQQLLPNCTLDQPKTWSSRRTLALDAATVEALRRHREAQVLERDFAADAYEDRDLVFCDQLGRPISPRVASYRFLKHRDAAGIPTGSLHTLRHTVATLTLTDGVPVHIVAARLGDDPTTILRTYSHLLPRSDEIAAQSLAAALSG
jgi:integrase